MSDHIGDTNKMIGNTPRTDARVRRMVAKDHSPEELKYWARELERELNKAKQHIERLEEAGKNLRECASWLGYAASQYGNNIIRAKAAIEAWDKEVKQ